MAEEDRTYTATVINPRAGHNFLLYCSRLSEHTSPRQENSFRDLTMATRVNPSSPSYSCTASGRKALSKAAHYLHILLLPHVLTLLGVSSTAWVNYTLQQLLSPNELAALYSFKTQMCYTSTGYTTVISVSSVLSEDDQCLILLGLVELFPAQHAWTGASTPALVSWAKCVAVCTEGWGIHLRPRPMPRNFWSGHHHPNGEMEG